MKVVDGIGTRRAETVHHVRHERAGIVDEREDSERVRRRGMDPSCILGLFDECSGDVTVQAAEQGVQFVRRRDATVDQPLLPLAVNEKTPSPPPDQ